MAKHISQFEAEQSDLVKGLEAQIDEKDRIINDIRKEAGNLEVLFNSLLANVSAIKPKAVQYKPHFDDEKSEVQAVMQICDGHMGAVQEADEIEGFNEYNPEICKARQMDYADRFIKYVDKHRKNYRIDECNVLVTGDLISGDIHQELQVTNAFPAPVQVVKAAEVLAEQMALISQAFSIVRVHFIGADNHGRLTKKPQAKQEGMNSFNYLVGVLAEAYLSQHINIDFNIYPMYEKVVQVGNRNYLITHGHGIRGWGGYPWYGVDRKMGKEAQARMRAIMEEHSKLREIGFHKFVFGHYHTNVETEMYMCCPSVQGTDAYDHQNGRFSGPAQAGWLVHPRWKETGREIFEL